MSTCVKENASHHFASFTTSCGPLTPTALSARFSSFEEGTLQKRSRKCSWQQRWDSSTEVNCISNHGPIVTPAVLKDEYKIVRKIGQGASGVVYEAIHFQVCIISLYVHEISFVEQKAQIAPHSNSRNMQTDIRTSGCKDCREQPTHDRL